MKSYKKVLLIIIMLNCFIFSGCWDYMEIEHMTLVYIIGIDYDKSTNEITITYQQNLPTQSKGEKSNSSNQKITYSASGKTFTEAIRKNQEALTLNLFYGYVQSVIIGEDAAKYITKDITEFISRTPSIRGSTYFMVTPGKAEKLIITENKAEQSSSGKQISFLISNLKSRGYTVPITFNDFEQMLSISGMEPIAPRVFIRSQQEGKENPKTVVISGLAAFKGDKFVGWLNDEESEGLSWIKSKNKNMFFAIKNDENNDKDVQTQKVLRLYITDSKCKQKVILNNGKPVIYLSIKVTAALRKYYSDEGEEYLTPDVINSMEEKLDNTIKLNIEKTVSKAQKDLNSDIFGFGFQFYRQHPKEWHEKYEKEWDNVFSSIPVKVSVKATIRNTGTNIRKFIVK